MLPKIHFSIERWKYNKEYHVWVSTEGNVRDKHKKPIKIRVNCNYFYVFCPYVKQFVKVHVLVMETFDYRDQETKKRDHLTIDHINSNNRDNRLKNLRWVSEKENLRLAREHDIGAAPGIDKPVQQTKVSTTVQTTVGNGRIKAGKIILKSPDKAASFVIAKSEEFNKLQMEREVKKLMQSVLSDAIPALCANHESKYGYQWSFEEVQNG